MGKEGFKKIMILREGFNICWFIFYIYAILFQFVLQKHAYLTKHALCFKIGKKSTISYKQIQTEG